MIIKGHVFTPEGRMIDSRRLPTLAAAISLTLGVGVARAQTVLVRNAPPDSKIEVVLNTAPVGETRAGAAGIGLVDVNLQKNVNKEETDAQVFVDVCPEVRRVVLVERALTPPSPDAGCSRRDMGGIFLVKRVSTLVIDFGGTSPTLLLRQGKVSLAPPRSWDGGRTGFMLFGGGGFTDLANMAAIACGTGTTQCSGKESGLGFNVGAEYWLTPIIAAEGTFLKPKKATATGSGDRYHFDNEFESFVGTAAGKIGIPAGRSRIYGHVGATYHQVTFDTNETLDELTTTTADGVTTTVPGGVQKYRLETRGWGWFFGGGLEVWLSGSSALYAEVGRLSLKGSAVKKEDGTTNERVTTLIVGVKARLF